MRGAGEGGTVDLWVGDNGAPTALRAQAVVPGGSMSPQGCLWFAWDWVIGWRDPELGYP